MKPGGEQCLRVSLTGAVSSQRVTEEREGTLSTVGNRASSAWVEECLTVRHTRRADAKAGPRSDSLMWNCYRSTDKRYARDNRLIAPKSSYRRRGLAPRCRLVTSWGWRRSQGFGCSPIKVARELGSERRETVRSLSTVGVGTLRGSFLSTRGPGMTHFWCGSCSVRGSAA